MSLRERAVPCLLLLTAVSCEWIPTGVDRDGLARVSWDLADTDTSTSARYAGVFKPYFDEMGVAFVGFGDAEGSSKASFDGGLHWIAL